MATTLIIPGLHSSGPDHWQNWFESHLASSIRVIQRDWRDANLPHWSQPVRREIHRNPDRIFLVAHSFGVLAAVQAGHDHRERIAGALFVAPADPDTFGVADFLPTQPLGFPSIVVASENDPWMARHRAAYWAERWGSDFVNLGKAGHINAEAGFGPWPQGLEIFESLRRSAEPLTQSAPVTGKAVSRRFEDIPPDVLAGVLAGVHGRANLATLPPFETVAHGVRL